MVEKEKINMKYIIVVLFAFFCCNTTNKETKDIKNITNLIINYEGDIDKPLPKIVFCKNCNDNYDFRVYQFKMSDDFFNSVNALLLLNKYSKERDNITVISIEINKREKYYLHKKESLLFINEIIKLSACHENNDLIGKQLFKYLTALRWYESKKPIIIQKNN